jgi:hypothetical protein
LEWIRIKTNLKERHDSGYLSYRILVPLGWKLYAITLLVLVLVASFVQYKAPSNLVLLLGQMCFVLALLLISIFFITQGHLHPDSPSYIEGDVQWSFFPHVGSWLAFIVFVISVAGWLTAQWWLSGIKDEFHKADIKLNELLFSLDLSPRPSYKITERLAWASTAPRSEPRHSFLAFHSQT